MGDPTGLAPVVKEVEWGSPPLSTSASTGINPVGGVKLLASKGTWAAKMMHIETFLSLLRIYI